VAWHTHCTGHSRVLQPASLRQPSGQASVRQSQRGFFTIDVEDWYHSLLQDPSTWRSREDRVVQPTLRLLELLAATGNYATFFVLGDVATRHPELVNAILQGGHEVGCHGHNHLTLDRLEAGTFAADLRRSLAALRAAGAREVVSFRAPFFSLNPGTTWALRVLAEHGIRIDSSVFPGRGSYCRLRPARAVPHRLGPIMEVPISLPRVCGIPLPLNGGFYARCFPRPVTRWAMRHLFAGATPPVYYVHPWELDPSQPRLPVAWPLAFRHYLRLERTEDVVKELLKHYRWRPLADLLTPEVGVPTSVSVS
jgi:polysaccharide deacetylase family protein (PEP-CTERM system associated)